MATLDDKARKFLEQPFVGTVTTLRQDGSPHSTIVWVDANGDVSFNTAVGARRSATCAGTRGFRCSWSTLRTRTSGSPSTARPS